MKTSGSPLPPALPGFEHIRRHYDAVQDVIMVKLLPGQFYITKAEEVICTTLGSCIAACVYDSHRKMAGMNHFMLPSTQNPSLDMIGEAARYGNWAMEMLINSMMKQNAKKEHLQFKIFGGGRVVSSMKNTQVGEMNAQFVLKYLQDEGLQLVAQDIGSTHARRIEMTSTTGKVRVKRLQTEEGQETLRSETAYMQTLQKHHKPAASSGSIELF